MPFVAKTNVVEAILHWTYHGIPALNVLDCAVGSGFSVNGSIANTVNTGVIAAITSSGLDVGLASTSVYTGVSLRDMRTEGGAAVPSNNGTHTGGGTGLALPAQDAICVSKVTNKAGRRFRGRTYIGGFTVGGVAADGSITAGFGTAAVDFMIAVAGTLVNNGLTVVVHTPAYPERPSTIPGHDPLPPTGEESNTVVQWVLKDHVWDTQRRRLR
jgi:hypothetical protein